MCECGHYKSQHRVMEQRGRLLCGYSGYACDCVGFLCIKKALDKSKEIADNWDAGMRSRARHPAITGG